MGRTPCCDKVGLKKGPWTPEEDQMLLAYIEEHGHGSWRALPAKAGLQRCGKSCRLRWTNYLRPDIKRGKFSLQEEQTIIQLHALLGNRWSAIATHLPKRTDNEIKNYWNTHLKKRLEKMGIDPVTHKSKTKEALFSGNDHSKNAANLSHMAQWESARLEAEARLVRQSKLRSTLFQNQLGSPALNLSAASTSMNNSVAPPNPLPCHDKLKAWKVAWNTVNEASGGDGNSGGFVSVHGGEVASPTSTLSFSENAPPVTTTGIGETSTRFIEFVGNSSGFCEQDWKRLGDSTRLLEFGSGLDNSMAFTPGIDDVTLSSVNSSLILESPRTGNHVHSVGNFVERFTELLVNNSGDRTFSGGEGDQSIGGRRGDYYEDNKSYWNSILNLVNASPSDPPMF